jgi:predicted TIM-barrel fold metal-dependent hydrolase
MGDNIVLVSADGHGSARPEDYRPYMDTLALEHFDEFLEDNAGYLKGMRMLTSPSGAFSPERLAVIDTDDAIGSGGFDGSWDLERRLQEMDRDGVVAEVVVYGHQNSMEPFFSSASRETPLDLRAAGLRAYHRWLADFVAAGEGRFVGIGDASGVDPDAMVGEVRWCAAHGLGAVMIPGMVKGPELPPLFDASYEPLWDACSDTGLRLVIHGGWGSIPQGLTTKMAGFMERFEQDPDMDQTEMMAVMAEMTADGDGIPTVEGQPRRAMWQMMVGGVFDRHPDLTLVLIEVRADWVPASLRLLDERFAAGDTPMTMSPSEYFAQNIYVAPSSPRRSEIELRHEIGVHRFLFGRDYPHPEGTWPNTADWIRATFAGVPEDEARLILGENAIECFGLDRDKLATLAAKIGPKPEDLLGDFDVDPALIEHFHFRSGYSAPANAIDEEALGRFVDQDLARLAAVGSP